VFPTDIEYSYIRIGHNCIDLKRKTYTFVDMALTLDQVYLSLITSMNAESDRSKVNDPV